MPRDYGPDKQGDFRRWGRAVALDDMEPAAQRRSQPSARSAPWAVGALCRAIADSLHAQFNPVQVVGEISGFTRAASGHCYFSLKDANGQLRCAMFRRAASLMDFVPQEGNRVEVTGQLGVYEPRGDLQLVVDAMRPAGQGALLEQFLRLKAELEAQGLFDVARKRALPKFPRAIGVVTSLGAAALHDVATALQRRVPHLPVVVAPAAVQGVGAPAELIQALTALYLLHRASDAEGMASVDVILLVRGGGSLEDLWSFNDAALVRCIASSPVPVVCGVGHETDFTLADFVADLRAPTPTAAAELVSASREVLLGAAGALGDRLQGAALRQVDWHAQKVDGLAAHLGRPSERIQLQRVALVQLQQVLARRASRLLHQRLLGLERSTQRWQLAAEQAQRVRPERLQGVAVRLHALDPHAVLRRGYAWLTNDKGRAVTSVAQVAPGDALQATLTDGVVDLRVTSQIPD